MVVVQSASREQRETLMALARFAGARTLAYEEGTVPESGRILLATSKASIPHDADHLFSGTVLVLPDAPLIPERDPAYAARWQVSAYSQDAIVGALRLVRDLPSELPEPPERTVPQIPSLRVLVAEDHPINQRLLTDQLETLGCKVTLANNGMEALARWQEGRFDIVMSDIHMPDLDGYGLVRQLRARGAKLPIVGLTAYTDAGVRKRAEAAGFDSLAIKPISLESLASALRAQVPSAIPLSDTPRDRDQMETPLSPGRVPEAIRDVFRGAMEVDLTTLSRARVPDELDAMRNSAHRMRGALAVLHDMHGVALCEAIETGATAGRPKHELSEHIRKLAKHLEPALETNKR